MHERCLVRGADSWGFFTNQIDTQPSSLNHPSYQMKQYFKYETTGMFACEDCVHKVIDVLWGHISL